MGNPTRSKPTPVEFPRFFKNPGLWISKAESYFDFYEIADNHKLSLASSYLDGPALSWYQWLLQNKQLVDWEHFIAKVLLLFPKLHLESLENHLANQMPSMTGYSSRFEAVSWDFTKTDVLSSCPTHVYTQGRSKNNPVLPQKFDMQFECKSKMDTHNMFDEMSTRVFTEKVEETSSAAILLGDLDDIQSTRVLEESVHSCCHKLVAEVQPDTLIKMLDEEALCLERSKVQLFDECSPRNMSKSVDVYGAAMNLCVWNPGISSKIKALTDYTLNTKLLILLGFTSTFGFIANANSVTQVWDPEQQRYELVVGKSKVDDTYSDVNRVFDDSSQGAASRELQPIAPLYIIFLPKLFQFLQQLLAQLIFVLQAPKSNIWYVAMGGDFSFRKKITEQASALKMVIQGKEAPKTICSAWLQGCIRSMADLIGLELRNFSMLAELKGLVGAQGDKITVCPPTFSLYEVVALQNCQNDHGSLYVIESELELVKLASIVVAYVVHKAILNESKSFSVLASCGKFKTMMRLMCYVAHLGGHRRIEECTVAQQVLKSNPVFKALNNVVAIQIKFLSHNGIFVEILGKTYGAATERSSAFIIIILEQNHHCFFLLRDVLMEINKMCRLRGPEAFSYIKRSYCLAGITDAHDSPNIEKVMKIVGLSKAEQVTNFKILASVMMLINMAYFMRHQDTILATREADFVGHQSSAARSVKNSRHVRKFFVYVQPWVFDNVVFGATLYNSNLEDKVLIVAGGIVMNGPRPVLAKQPKTILSGHVWDPN